MSGKIVGYSNKAKTKYFMRFLDHILKPYTLAKPTKDLTTW